MGGTDDDRPDELLERHGRLYSRLGWALAWTNGLANDADAKACTGTGSRNWKNAKPLSTDPEAADAFFKTRARKRNPTIPGVANGLMLVEYDGENGETRAELNAKHKLPPLPATLTACSRRGDHLYLRPPPGRPPIKVQVSLDAVTSASDGYLVAPPAWRAKYDFVYSFADEDAGVAECPLEVYDKLIADVGESTRERALRTFESSEPIPKGDRDMAIFWAATTFFQRGESVQAVLERMRELNRTRCVPPLEEKLVRKQVNGAAKWAAAHPTVSDELRVKARQILEDRRTSPAPTPRAVGSWEDPVPLASREAAPAFPIETLLDWAAAWASAISAEKGAALDLGASLALDVVAGAIARNVQVSPRPGWYEPTNLYTIVALAPGQRKSPVFKAALRPVRALERQRMQAWEEQQQLVGLSGAIFDKRRKELIAEAADADELDPEQLSERMEELLEGLGPTEAEPRPRLLTEDVTPEGLAGLLADHGRIIAASDEGAAIFENLAGRYARGSTSWDVLNKAHSSADLVVDRKSSGPVIVYDPAITLAITTQPEMLRALARKPGVEGRGVLARPLYALPAPVYADGVTRAADPSVLEEYARRIRNVYSDTPELEFDEDDHPRPALLTLSEGAREAFERFEAELNQERRELGGDDLEGESVYLGWLSKLAGQAARLAAVLHAADHWTDGVGVGTLVIDEPTMARAITLARYYRLHALAVFGLIGELPEQQRARSILRWLKTRPPAELEGLTVRDVHRTRGKGTTAVQVRVALALLEQHGYLRFERQSRTGSAGRPSERIHVHPEIENRRDRPDKPDIGSPASGLSSRSACEPPVGLETVRRAPAVRAPRRVARRRSDPPGLCPRHRIRVGPVTRICVRCHHGLFEQLAAEYTATATAASMRQRGEAA
jgi:replicative DNA helicase